MRQAETSQETTGALGSTADETTDDNTIRRCIGFAKRDGFGGLNMLNLYGYRSTKPYFIAELTFAGKDAVGPENDAYIRAFAATSERVICAWGTWAFAGDRAARVIEMLTSLGRTPHCFGKTKDGSPRHPLYLPGDTPTIPYP